MPRQCLTLGPMLRALAVASVSMALGPASWGQVEIPASRDRAVHDYAGVVLVEDSEVVEQVAREVGRESGLRMTVVTVKSLEGENPEVLAGRWMSGWNLGQAEGDRSLFLLVVAGEGKVALQASPAASSLFTDPVRRSIVEESVRPYLQRGDYSLGVRRGMEKAARIAAEGYGFGTPEALSSPLDSLLTRGGSLALLLAGILAVALGVPVLLWWLLLGGERGGGRNSAGD